MNRTGAGTAGERLAWGIAAVGAACVLWTVSSGPVRALASLDFLPGILVDYQKTYFAQAQMLLTRPGAVHAEWLYPPLFAILLQPLTALGRTASIWIWLAVELGLMAWLIVLCRNELRAFRALPAWGAAASLVLLSLPVIHNLKWGQISLLLGVGSLFALRRGSGLGAAAMGLVTALKLYPAGYLLGALVHRRWRFLVVAAVCAVVLGGALPLLVLGAADAAPFFDKFFGSSQGFASPQQIPGAQGLSGGIDSWFRSRIHFGLPRDPRPWLFPLGDGARRILAIVLSVGLIGATARRLHGRSPTDPAAVALGMVAVTLVLRPSWHHYFAFLPFALAVALARGASRAAVLALVFVSWAVAAVPVLALAAKPAVFHWYSSLGGTTVAALCAWAALWLVTGDVEPASTKET